MKTRPKHPRGPNRRTEPQIDVKTNTTACTTWFRSTEASHQKVEASVDVLTNHRFKFRNCTQLILLWEFIAGKNWSQLCPGRFLQHFLAELFSADFCNFSRPNFGNIFWPNFATFFRPNFATFFRPNFATIFWPTFATISWLYFATIFWPNFATFLL